MANSDGMNIKHEDQPKQEPSKVIGYRQLTEVEITLMNDCTQLAIHVGKQLEVLEAIPSLDKRWLAIAKTDLQKGFMSLIRSIARPETF